MFALLVAATAFVGWSAPPASLKRTGAVRTLMGRYRPLPGINSRNAAARSHSERAAINTPIQGGAADIMTLAMLKLRRGPETRLPKATEKTEPESEGGWFSMCCAQQRSPTGSTA